MARALHLIKREEASVAQAVVEAQLAAGDSVTVVLLNDAPAPKLPTGVRVLRVPQEASYAGLLEMIFESSPVITW